MKAKGGLEGIFLTAPRSTYRVVPAVADLSQKAGSSNTRHHCLAEKKFHPKKNHPMSHTADSTRHVSGNPRKEITMTPRLNPFTASPAAMQPWIDLGKTIQTNGLEPLLRELVMTRASQINGCAFCIHHH